MEYRDEHPIGKRLNARRAVFPFTPYQTDTFAHLNQASFKQLKRKISAAETFDSVKTDLNSWQSGNIGSNQNDEWADIPWKLYEQLQKLEDSPSDESSCNDTSSTSSSAPLVTFKKSRDDDDDDDILFKLEHDSTSNDGTLTRSNSAKSEPLSSLDEEPDPSFSPEEIEWETNNDFLQPEVPSTPEKQQKPIKLLKSPQEFSKKWRRAASLDSRVRTMLLLEKQRFHTKPFPPSYADSSATSKKDDSDTWTTFKKTEDQLEIDKTNEWFESCFSPNSTTTNEITKARKVSLRKIKNSLNSKKEQCESCLSVLRFLLIRTGKELLDRLDEKSDSISPTAPITENNAFRKEKYCHKCKKLLSSADRSNDCDDDGEFRVKLRKLRSDTIFVPKEAFPDSAGKRSKGPKKEPIHNGPKSEKQEHGTKAVKTRGSNLQVLISGWQFVGEPSNKRMYCRHPDGAYRSVVRSCYDSVINDDVVLNPGDYVLIAAQSMTQPFVAYVQNLYICPITGNKMAHVFWFYGQEVIRNQNTKLHEREIMASKHADDIDLNCIDDKCFVLTFNHYCRFMADQAHKNLSRCTKKFVHKHVKCYRTSKPAATAHLRPQTEEVSFSPEIISSLTSPDSTGRKIPTYKQLEDTDPECIFWCNKVFDLQRKQILKYPH